MKEKLYTIALNDALHEDDECMFCFLERKLEQDSLSFVLGSSYMESDVREQTDRLGFCRQHMKQMFDYGNALGNAWIMKSRLEYLRRGLAEQTERYKGEHKEKRGWISGLREISKQGNAKMLTKNQVARWIKEEEEHCYLCERIHQNKARMIDSFFLLLRTEETFGQRLKNSKGFCLPHFAEVLILGEEKLPESLKEQWIPFFFRQMGENLDRLQQDVDWLIEKYDYRNQNADWKSSQDALQRAMQKTGGGYPADPVFRERK